MKNLILILTAVTTLVLQGCKEIIAENISGKTPVIIIPANGQTVTQNPVHFKWEPMSGATKYHLQVVSPSFANISVYALDSVITGTDFYMALDSNSYELKLTAMNAGYSSNTLSGVHFVVGVPPTSGGGGNTVVLKTPEDNAYFNSADAFQRTFTWTDLPNETHYELYLKRGSSFSGGVDVVPPYTYISPPQKTLDASVVLTEGQYHWGVRAYLNDETETALSKRTFFIDTTRPNAPGLISPSSMETPGPIVFTWSNGSSDPGTVHSPVNSIIEISDNQNFSVILETKTVQGTTTTINLMGSGQRFWRVRNRDDAGNQSAYSSTMIFTL